MPTWHGEVAPGGEGWEGAQKDLEDTGPATEMESTGTLCVRGRDLLNDLGNPVTGRKQELLVSPQIPGFRSSQDPEGLVGPTLPTWSWCPSPRAVKRMRLGCSPTCETVVTRRLSSGVSRMAQERKGPSGRGRPTSVKLTSLRARSELHALTHRTQIHAGNRASLSTNSSFALEK